MNTETLEYGLRKVKLVKTKNFGTRGNYKTIPIEVKWSSLKALNVWFPFDQIRFNNKYTM